MIWLEYEHTTLAPSSGLSLVACCPCLDWLARIVIKNAFGDHLEKLIQYYKTNIGFFSVPWRGSFSLTLKWIFFLLNSSKFPEAVRLWHPNLGNTVGRGWKRGWLVNMMIAVAILDRYRLVRLYYLKGYFDGL